VQFVQQVNPGSSNAWSKLCQSIVALDCIIVADDLTGACDAAVHFAARGYATNVCISSDEEEVTADVIAVSTDSRDREPMDVHAVMANVASRLPYRSAATLFKKIDSTLRGNVGAEIAAALDVFCCDAAVVCPASPALHRVVEAGYLRVSRAEDFEPIDVLACLKAQGLKQCVHARPGGIGNAISAGARVVSLDAVCQEDLHQIVIEALDLDRRVLCVGSGGFASAIARTLPVLPKADKLEPVSNGPVLFCIGSDHLVTMAQQAVLQTQRPVLMVQSEEASREDIISALSRRQHVCLRLPRSYVSPGSVRELIHGVPAAALLLSGGDTASLICAAMGVRHIELHDEIAPGIPCGLIRGGEFDGASVVTKSGAFGGSDALIQVADFFSCHNN
jgi:D-threonate/D-erythronate kinase